MKTLARYVLLSILLAVAVCAQPRVTLTGPPTAVPGQVIDVVANLTGSAPLAGLQITVPTGATVKTQPPMQNKTLACVPTVCMWYGLANGVYNSLPMTDGQVLTLAYTIPASAAIGSSITISVAPIYAADVIGAAATVGNTPLTITVVRDPLDLNSDGVVNQVDAQQAFTVWSGAPTEANAIVLWSLAFRLRVNP